jgi:hypothetical protein
VQIQCSKYWPDKPNEVLVDSQLHIRLVDAVYYADYAMRTFEMERQPDEVQVRRMIY